MNTIEKNFDDNTNYSLKNAKYKCILNKIKSSSREALTKLLRSERKYDLIYVDACHKAKSVLFDAVVGFELLNDGGVIVFDDYLWDDFESLARSPKIAIDAFTSCMINEISIIGCAYPNMGVQRKRIKIPELR